MHWLSRLAKLDWCIRHKRYDGTQCIRDNWLARYRPVTMPLGETLTLLISEALDRKIRLMELEEKITYLRLYNSIRLEKYFGFRLHIRLTRGTYIIFFPCSSFVQLNGSVQNTLLCVDLVQTWIGLWDVVSGSMESYECLTTSAKF